MIRTTVYWLVDTRAEVLMKWPIGEPFYCGRTTMGAMWVRNTYAPYIITYHPRSPLAQRLKACGKHVRVHVIAEVPPDGDATAVHRRALERLRHLNPTGCANGHPGKRRMRTKQEAREMRERLVRDRLAR